MCQRSSRPKPERPRSLLTAAGSPRCPAGGHQHGSSSAAPPPVCTTPAHSSSVSLACTTVFAGLSACTGSSAHSLYALGALRGNPGSRPWPLVLINTQNYHFLKPLLHLYVLLCYWLGFLSLPVPKFSHRLLGLRNFCS